MAHIKLISSISHFHKPINIFINPFYLFLSQILHYDTWGDKTATFYMLKPEAF